MTKNSIEGVFKLANSGTGYVRSKELDFTVEIPEDKQKTALNRDIVKVIVIDTKNQIGEVVSIVSRAKIGFTGSLVKSGNFYKLKPTDGRDPEILVSKEDTMDATEEQKVFVIITKFKDDGTIIGKVKKIIGESGDNDTEMYSLAIERGFDYEFPKEVEDEAKKLKEETVSKQEIEKRRDIRGIVTFTIDPEDAKDFDDALSFRKLENNNYEIGIHIADVSYYVRPGSQLDKEASKRTTSVYLVDRTIPMLPEILSNDLCSLNPNEDKLAFSAIFEIEPKSGEVKNEWFGRTIINSDKRFTYEEAQEILDLGKGEFVEELQELNRLAKVYEKNRFAKGSLNFETDEVRFNLDENGHPISVYVKERIDTNKLIEEFMLLANSHVAEFMAKKTKLFVYRVHDKPEEEKMKFLGDFLNAFGYNVHYKNGIIPVETLQKIIEEVESKDEKETVQTMIIRSMQKAIYSTKNIGHFGLAFPFYTHFTSPIRRYPDILVHRLLSGVLKNEKLSKNREWYEKMCQKSSEKEKDAAEAERDSIKYKQVEFMADRIGQVFEGIVTGTSKFGVFVAEKESLSEGMIRMSNLGDDFFIFDEDKREIKGQNSGEIFKLGVKLRIKVKSADINTKMIDYERA